MATIINNPGDGNNSGGNAAGIIVGIVLVVIVLFVFFVYGLPAIRGTRQSSGTTVNVPDKIDVNVNKTN